MHLRVYVAGENRVSVRRRSGDFPPPVSTMMQEMKLPCDNLALIPDKSFNFSSFAKGLKLTFCPGIDKPFDIVLCYREMYPSVVVEEGHLFCFLSLMKNLLNIFRCRTPVLLSAYWNLDFSLRVLKRT